MPCGNEILCYFQPFLMNGIDTAGFGFIRPHPVDAPHENITEFRGHCNPDQKAGIQMEAGVALNSRQIQGNDGNLFHAGLFQGSPDKTHIVGGPAPASCLGHDDGGFVQVIFSGQQRFHNLAYHQKGGIAGVIIDIF